MVYATSVPQEMGGFLYQNHLFLGSLGEHEPTYNHQPLFTIVSYPLVNSQLVSDISSLLKLPLFTIVTH